MTKIVSEEEFHNGNIPVYTPQGDEKHARFKMQEGIANVVYVPAHENVAAPKGLEGSGQLIGKWLYNEQPDKQERLLKSTIELFMDSTLAPYASVGLHKHIDTEEIYYLLEGQLTIDLIDKNGVGITQIINPGDTHLIQPGESHFVEAGAQGARFMVVAAKVS